MTDFSFLNDIYGRFRIAREKESFNRQLKSASIFSEAQLDKDFHGKINVEKTQFGPTIEKLALNAGMTPQAWYLKFLDPFLELSPSQIADIQEVLSGWVGRAYSGTALDFSAKPLNEMEAQLHLAWLDLRMKNLNLKGFDPLQATWDKNVSLAGRQCQYCGKKEDETKEPFNAKKIFCHTLKCPSKEKRTSNPKPHKDCCYGQWVHKREMFKQKVSRIIEKGEGAYTKIEHLFLDFCRDELIDIRIVTEGRRLEYLIKCSSEKAAHAQQRFEKAHAEAMQKYR